MTPKVLHPNFQLKAKTAPARAKTRSILLTTNQETFDRITEAAGGPGPAKTQAFFEELIESRLGLPAGAAKPRRST